MDTFMDFSANPFGSAGSRTPFPSLSSILSAKLSWLQRCDMLQPESEAAWGNCSKIVFLTLTQPDIQCCRRSALSNDAARVNGFTACSRGFPSICPSSGHNYRTEVFHTHRPSPTDTTAAHSALAVGRKLFKGVSNSARVCGHMS